MSMSTSLAAKDAPLCAMTRFNHWLTAIVMIGMLVFGLYLENAEIAKADKGALIGLHKAIGVAFLAFVVWRIGHRLAQGFPEPAAPASPSMERLARIAHWGLLASILIMPVSGVLMSLFGGHAIDVFGLFTIPTPGKVEAIGGAAHLVHGLAGKLTIALILLHVAAALKHHILDKDATLSRMLGRGGSAQGERS